MTKQEEKTHWKKQFNYNYLGAYSIPEGKDVVVTIKEWKKEMVVEAGTGAKKECLVCYFTDADKPMILNKTNCKIIEKLYGSPYLEDWGGKKITLFAQSVKAYGEYTDALRIRDTKPYEELDNNETLVKMALCENLAELQKFYHSLPKPMQANKGVLALKDKLKKTLK